MQSKGKAFEQVFREDWKRSFPNSFIYRLPDQISGYKTSSVNISDFICFANRKLYLIECKSHKGASIPFDKITQYDSLKSAYNMKVDGLVIGVVIWLYDKDVVYFLPIETMIKMVDDGEKSFGIRSINKYNVIEIPSIKKRIYMTSDYSVLDKEKL